MYVPEAFRVDERSGRPALLANVAEYPFATVITRISRVSRTSGTAAAGGDDALEVSHLPLLLSAPPSETGRTVLRGHLARENPQVSHFAAGADVLAIFHGPHGYVSPSVYAAKSGVVPTWNYVVVHARGRARLVDEPALVEILDDMVARFDTTGWRFPTDDEARDSMLAAIAGFEIEVERLEGKWKMSQNRSPEDQESVIRWLERGDDSSRALAVLMRGRR